MSQELKASLSFIWRYVVGQPELHENLSQKKPILNQLKLIFKICFYMCVYLYTICICLSESLELEDNCKQFSVGVGNESSVRVLHVLNL